MTNQHNPWPEADVETLRRLRTVDRLTATEIGARMGYSRSAILGKLSRLGITVPPGIISLQRRIVGDVEEECERLLAAGLGSRAIAQQTGFARNTVMNWKKRRGIASSRQTRLAEKPEKVALLRAMYSRGDSFDQIALALGVTGQTVRNALSELGLRKQEPMRQRPTNARERSEIKLAYIAAADAGLERVEACFAEGYGGQHGRVFFWKLRPGVCRYPIEMSSGETRYCGETTMREGGAYCELHHARCHSSRAIQ